MTPEAEAAARLILTAYAATAGRKPKETKECRRRIKAVFTLLECSRGFATDATFTVGDMRRVGTSVCHACQKCKGGVPVMSVTPPQQPSAAQG